MIRRPPRSTLFPYTRSSDLDTLRKGRHRLGVAESCTGGMIGERLTNIPRPPDTFIGGVVARSGEPTPELQSRLQRVCRPMLGKKQPRARHPELCSSSSPTTA